MKQLSSWVGTAGAGQGNRRQDVLRIQAMINMVPSEQCGFDEYLKLDGICGPKTKEAIKCFQTTQFGKADGRIDPSGATAKKLAEMEGKPDWLPMQCGAIVQPVALAWLDAGVKAINQAMDGPGTPKPANSVPAELRHWIESCFRISWEQGAGNSYTMLPANQETLGLVRKNLMAARAAVNNGLRYTPLEYVEMYMDLASIREMVYCLTSSLGISTSLATTAPDEKNQCGGETEHVAACALMSAVRNAGFDAAKNSGPGVSSTEWPIYEFGLGLGVGTAANIMRKPLSYLIFCQLVMRYTSFYYMAQYDKVMKAESRKNIIG